ncbi:MAG: tRNA 2-thiouridine(34) synthase MnmA, partial [Rhodospirillaceae bacterium]
AKDLGADALATCHYVRRVGGPQGVDLRCAADDGRDQSYFLFATTREQLEFLRFPLGDLTKSAARELARELGIHVSEKPDSQDICFVPNGKYADVIQSLRPDATRPGEIVHIDGRILGNHDGVIHFTVGQRKGLGVGGEAEPLYVVRIEPETARVVVGPKDALLKRSFAIHSVNWLGAGSGPVPDGASVKVKLRNTHAPMPATIFPAQNDMVNVVLTKPEAAVSPGQACVFYDGKRVLGGGWICRDEAAVHRPHNLRRAV